MNGKKARYARPKNALVNNFTSTDFLRWIVLPYMGGRHPHLTDKIFVNTPFKAKETHLYIR